MSAGDAHEICRLQAGLIVSAIEAALFEQRKKAMPRKVGLSAPVPVPCCKDQRRHFEKFEHQHLVCWRAKCDGFYREDEERYEGSSFALLKKANGP